MNLIERLGGYEAAKAEGEEWGFDDFLNNQLLEYRRQHNIFEVGDDVVVLTNALGNKYTWIVKSIDGIMVEISQLGQPNEWVHYSEIAHTTPEEIKAGKRLEVK